MELKGRLKVISDKVPQCQILCDIGTDHAYIPIYLMHKGKCKRAIASDVGKGPLKKAVDNVREYGLEDRIETRIGDGLETISEEEADVIVIAGMGGLLITQILEKGLVKAKKAQLLILQPMKRTDKLREWLYSEGFAILDEELVNEGEKIYNIICARWTGICKKYNIIDTTIGTRLIEKRDPLLKKYVMRKIRVLEKIISQMEKSQIFSNKFEENIKIRDGLKEILYSLSGMTM